MLIYISGPVSGISNYKENFLKVKKLLESKGFKTLSILDVPCLGDGCFTWSDCMKVAITLLEKCDKIYLMDGWQQSSGARIEKIWAERTNKGIYVL